MERDEDILHDFAGPLSMAIYLADGLLEDCEAEGAQGTRLDKIRGVREQLEKMKKLLQKKLSA